MINIGCMSVKEDHLPLTSIFIHVVVEFYDQRIPDPI